MNGEGKICQFEPQEGIEDAISAAATAGCNTDAEKMLLAAQCEPAGRNIIAEKTRDQGFRTIDSFKCPSIDVNSPGQISPSMQLKGMVFFSHPDEMITEDPKTGALHFYKYEEGKLNFQGNSFTKGNPCLRCHTMGGLVMKELAFPWRNWLGNRFDDPTAEERAAVHPKPLFAGPEVEQTVRMSDMQVSIAYKAGLRNGRKELEGETLKDLLKPLFCTVDVNLATHIEGITPSAQSPAGEDAPQPAVHALFLSASLIFDPQLAAPIGIQGNEFAGAPSNGDVKKYLASIGVPGSDIVAIPSPANASVMRLSMLSSSQEGDPIFDPIVIMAARAIDFPNPVFSKKRCGLWQYIPATPMSQLKTPKAVSDKLNSALANVQDPVAKEFIKYLNMDPFSPEFSQDLMQKMTKFISACFQEGGTLKDAAKVYRLIRARTIPLLQTTPLKYFDKLSIVEHFPGNENSPSKMFPEYQAILDGKYAGDEGLALDEKCQLVK